MGINGNKALFDYKDDWLNTRHYTKEEVEIAKCPFCDSDDCILITKERTSIGIVRCRVCGLIYVNPRLKSPEKIYWADAQLYYEEAKLIFMGIKPHHRDKNYLEDLRIIKRFKPGGNFLDIGVNAGFFLRQAKKNGNWNIFGLEPSKSLAELARKYFSLNIKNCFLEEAGFQDDFFDIVTMIDVFEHIPNPCQMLGVIRRLLKKDGILFIKVPNGLFNLTKLRLARLTNKINAYDIFDSYEHLVHYTHNTLSRMFEKNGFTVIYEGVGRPIQTPVWHKYTGRYYQYPMPWPLDVGSQTLRMIFYFFGLLEYCLRGFKAGHLAPNIIIVARKA